jgi:ergothioneine biosynthesis protein EgtB
MNLTLLAKTSHTENLQSRLREARARSEELFSIVLPAALYDRPIPERHRIIFYMGHLESFDWNLFQAPLGLTSLDPAYDNLFAFGIDPVDGGLPSDVPADWPSIDRIHSYAERLRVTLDRAIHAVAERDPILTCLEHGRLLEVAIEHRLMHVETLSYMLHQLPFDRKLRLSDNASPQVEPRTSHSVEIPAGTATLGLARNSQEEYAAFGWDNEFEVNRVEVPAFSIDAYSITNGDFLRFMNEGGYHERSYWSDAGWKWITSQGVRRPAFWVPGRNSWRYRTMFDLIPLPVDWPAYVSHDEATAYARWVGKQLPSEAEWHRAACGTRSGGERKFPWGDDEPSSLHGNFDFYHWDPTPVGSYPGGNSDFGVTDLVGNGWEWTSTPFEPFPGFQPFSFYRGYSANFFDGKHFVMKGGSARTAACMIRRSFRNWFQPHYPYVYAKFRCVER